MVSTPTTLCSVVVTGIVRAWLHFTSQERQFFVVRALFHGNLDLADLLGRLRDE